VQAAFKKLQSNVDLTAGVTIGDYATTLQYTQTGLVTHTDESLNLILPVLAQPIVQKIVGGSLLGFVDLIATSLPLMTYDCSLENVLIKNPEQNSFSKSPVNETGPYTDNVS
jgi:hypothetical protein